MSNHHRFRLSHLMPNSWFYKLRDMKRPRPQCQRSTTASRSSKRSSLSHYYHGATNPMPLPLSPRQSYSSYQQTKQWPVENPKASDIQFPKDHHHSSSRSAAVVVEEFQDLQLRPIRTRPASTESGSARRSTIASGTCPSSPRLRSRRSHVLGGCKVSTPSTSTGRRRRSSARRSFAVVMASTDPYRDFRASMVEMVEKNNLRARDDLEDLLKCYLSLNSREYPGVIIEVFMRIWLEVTDDSFEE